MRLIFGLCLLVLLIVPLQAQEVMDNQNLSLLDVQAVRITRTEDDALSLEIEATSDVCGELLIHEWYSEVAVDARSSEAITILAGDARRTASGQQYANLSLYILTDDSDDCNGEHIISLALPPTIEMQNVPDNRDASFQDTVLLVNDFATWFHIDNEDNTSTSLGQTIDIGETELGISTR